MTATTTGAGVVAGAAAGVAAAGVTKEAKGCQGSNTHKCQDINANERHWYEDDINSGGGGGGAGGVEYSDRTQYHQHHNGRTLQHNHLNGKSPHHLNSHHQKKSQEDEQTFQLVPPDGGWGWMVVLGAFIITTLLPSLGPCFGVLFSEYLLSAGSSSTTTAWIFNLQCFLWNVIGPLARPLTEEFGWRRVGLTGTIMAAAGLMISAFTPSPSFLFFSFSILTGLGGGVVTCQCFIILPQYFERRRGLSNAIMMCGICMGQLVGPPFARSLQASYGFRGATLIIGAVALNSVIGASFFHPIEWHQKKVPLEEEPREDVLADTSVFPAKTKVVGPPDLTRDLVHSPSEASFPGGVAEGDIDGSLAVRARLLGRLGGRRTSYSSRRSSRYNSTLSLSSLDVGSLAALPLEDEPEDDEGEEEGGRDSLIVRVMKGLIRDLGAVRSMRACIVFLGATMCINGYLNFIMMVPFAMLEAGFPLDTSAWCITLYAGCNMVTRFVVSTLSDWERFNKRLAYMCGFAIIASTMFAFTFVSSKEWLMVTMAVNGFGVGANMGIYSIVIIDVMGLENLASVFGTTCFFVAIGFLFIGPFIGYMRDVTQSYAVSMRITGGMLVVGLVGWLFMGLAEKVDRRKEENKTQTDVLQKT